MDNISKALIHINYKGTNEYGIAIYERIYICPNCKNKLNIIDETQLIKGIKCEKCNEKIKNYEEIKEEKNK